MTQALNLANFANNLNTAGATSNAGLQNSSVTVTAGTGMSGGGSVALGSSVTLTNAGVTSLTAGTGISLSGSTGAVTITNSSSGGVTSLNGQTGALNGLTYVTAGNISTTPSTSFTITGLPSGYQFFKVIINARMNNSDSGVLYCRFSNNNGASYFSNGYSPATIRGDNSGTDTSNSDTGAGGSWIRVGYTPGGSTNTWVMMDMTISESGGTGLTIPMLTGITTCGSNGGDPDQILIYGSGNPTNISGSSYINALQILQSGASKQFNGGYWYVYGMK